MTDSVIPQSNSKLKAIPISQVPQSAAMAKKEWEQDPILRRLCLLLLEDRMEDATPKWSLAGFRQPQFYREAFNAGKYRADLIVFDWEYDGNVDQVSELRKILTGTHSEVFIFTGADKVDQINIILAEHLGEFKARLIVIDKNGEDDRQHEILHDRLTKKQSECFAFRFGSQLRATVNKSLDEALHKLSTLDIQRILYLLSSEEGQADNTEFKEMLGEKIKNGLQENEALREALKAKGVSGKAYDELLEVVGEIMKNDVGSEELVNAPVENGEEREHDKEIIEALWSYRLYHKPSDDRVRTGDILEREDGSEQFLVLTPPCDLTRFWKNTGGILSLVQLHDIDEKAPELRKLAALTRALKEYKKKDRRVTSLTNPLSPPGGQTLLPFVQHEEGRKDYLVKLRQIQSIYVAIPEKLSGEENRGARANASLSYTDVGFRRICRVSDPFNGPLISTVLATLAGWGVEDFPAELQKQLGTKLIETYTEPAQ